MLGTPLQCGGTLKEFQLFPRHPFPGDSLARAQVISERTAIQVSKYALLGGLGKPLQVQGS